MQFTIFDYEKEYDPDNPASIWEYIDIQSPISIRHGYKLDDGRIEWLSPDKYLLDGRPEIGENRATFKATKLTGYMTDTIYLRIQVASLYITANGLQLMPFAITTDNPPGLTPLKLQRIYMQH